MKTIMIIGAGPLQVPVIKKAKDLGHRVITIDGNPNAVGFKYSDKYEIIDITNEKKALKYAIKNEIDGVITVATDYGVLSAANIAKVLDLKFVKHSVCKTIKNKFEVKKRLDQNKKSNFFEIKSVSDIEFIKNKIVWPSIMKPVDGSGSRGVYIIKNINDIYNFFDKCISESLIKSVVIEKMIVGKEYGVECFVLDKKINILGIMEKTMTKPPIFSELGHVFINEECDLTNKIGEYCKKIIKDLEIDFGSVNMDLLVEENSINLIDIGVRAGGNLISSHIIPLSTGINIYENSIKAALNEPTNFVANDKKVPIATRILDLKSGTIKNIDYSELEKIKKIFYVRDIILNVDIGNKVREYKNNLDSCGYVVVEGNSISDAKEKAFYIRNLVENIISII